MTRHPFGWDLPPGVTQRMIDEAAGDGNEFMVAVDNGDPIPWSEFTRLNEALSNEELDDIQTTLFEQGSYTGGGGAAQEFTVTLVED